MGDGTCDLLTITAAKGTLTDPQRTTLASLAQEEQLAHDLYVAFAARYDAVIFDRIAVAEERHLATLRMGRYAVTDPTAGQPAGRFTDRRSGQLRQAAGRRIETEDCTGVGRTVEQTDSTTATALVG
jgi:hypothetical protein